MRLTRRLKCSSFFCREPPWNLPEGFAGSLDFQTPSRLRGLLKGSSSYSLLVYTRDQEASLSCLGSFLLEEFPAPGGTAVCPVSSWYLRLQCAPSLTATKHIHLQPDSDSWRGEGKARTKEKGRKRINETRESGLRKIRKSTLGVAGGTGNTRASTMRHGCSAVQIRIPSPKPGDHRASTVHGPL